MNERFRISVIMGIYNCEETLEEALDSLYKQSFQSFQVILCDDGSSDNTYSIASRIAKEHDNIILLRNVKNMGLNYTLNRCLQFADTEYIARMDGDDISKPDRFEKEVDFLDSHPEYHIVSTSMAYFDKDGVFMIGHAKGEPNKFDFIKGTPFCHAPCMVRKEAYDAVGGYSISDRLLRVEDYHLWLKMYLKGYRGYRLDEPLYMMRDDRNAVSRRNFKSRCNEAYVKYLVYKEFKLPLYTICYCFKPVMLGIMPSWLYALVRKKTHSNN